MTTRRHFLKTACGFCAAVAGAGVLATLLDGCSSIPVVKASPSNNNLSVPVSAFKEGVPYITVRRPNLEPDILLVKKKDGTYNALLMVCTHEEQPLSVGGNTINCAAHGSTFDLDGNVTHAPAAKALTRFAATVEGETILIHLNQKLQ